MTQKIITNNSEYSELDNWIEESHIRRILLVCGSSLEYQKELLAHIELLQEKGIKITKFSDYAPNPKYESVIKGVNVFLDSKSDCIIAVGGGSAIDVAKCIKLFSNMDCSKNYLEQQIIPNDIPFLAIPTTAGTGSEATRYAVIYYKDEKKSVTHDSCIPSVVLMDSSLLKSLPLYHRKATMMDALCHAIESYWSINSTDESKVYSRRAITSILENMDAYLENDDNGNKEMLVAANFAGRAINITQTTAGHAMAYKLTSMFGIAHGHATALCNIEAFDWIIDNIEKCNDKRGIQYLKTTLDELAYTFGCKTPHEAAGYFKHLVEKLGLERPITTYSQIPELANSVNIERLKNYPIQLSSEDIKVMYERMLLDV